MTEKKKFARNPIKGTRYSLVISSAKGGVGKSTFAINIAFALKHLGLKVGVLDADIFGPSLPKLIGSKEKPQNKEGKFIVPIEKEGVQCMSMGFLVDEITPMIWRGPMVISAIKTLTQNVLWTNLDFIIIDLPPGTGDTQLSFAQDIKIDGAIIVSTPQELALLDVKRGIQMFDKLNIKILNLINNMSYFKTDDGKEYHIFGRDGVENTAKEFNKRVLGNLPLNEDLRKSADKGEPLTMTSPDHKISKLFNDIAKQIKQFYP